MKENNNISTNDKDGIYDVLNYMEDEGMISEEQFDRAYYLIEDYLIKNNLFITGEGYSVPQFVRIHGENIINNL